MGPFIQEFIEVGTRAASPSRAFASVAEAACSLGFEHCAIGVRLPYPISRPRIETFSNYPEAWRNHYLRSGYLFRDPSVAHGQRSCVARTWDDQLFADEPTMWDEARSAGLRHGWFKSTLETSGCGSMLTLARSHDEFTPNELRAVSEKLSWLAHAAHLVVMRALLPTEATEPNSTLTAREIEVLRWTADGKSSSEIADILTISDNTVNFHIKNAVRKLGANNKTSATVRATVMGLLA